VGWLILFTFFVFVGAFQAHIESFHHHLRFLGLLFEIKQGFPEIFLGEGCVACAVFEFASYLVSYLKLHLV